MAAPACWKGYLRLSLVTIGIELYTAVNSGKVTALHQIHKPSGKRIKFEKVAPGIGAVNTRDIVKGIEIDPRYCERPCDVTSGADEVAAEGFAVIREALRKARKVGLGQMATRGRDQICAVRACGDGLLLETPRYANEAKDSDTNVEAIASVKPDEEMLSLAAELIRKKTHKFEPDKVKSHYTIALRALIDEKRKKTGEVSHATDEELGVKGQNDVIDLRGSPLRR